MRRQIISVLMDTDNSSAALLLLCSRKKNDRQLSFSSRSVVSSLQPRNSDTSQLAALIISTQHLSTGLRQPLPESGQQNWCQEKTPGRRTCKQLLCSLQETNVSSSWSAHPHKYLKNKQPEYCYILIPLPGAQRAYD